MDIAHTHSPHPLEADWVDRSLAIAVEERAVTGVARANWGAIEVTIASPIAGLTRGRDGRGWCFALACHHRPEYRYALGGQFTAKGVETAERILADLYLDWVAVCRHEAEVDAMGRRTRQELADLRRSFEVRSQPAMQERQGLRRAFKAGELTQQGYQQRLKELGKLLDRFDREWREAERAAGLRFGTWLEGCCGRRVSLEEVEKLLTEVAVVVAEVPDLAETPEPAAGVLLPDE